MINLFSHIFVFKSKDIPIAVFKSSGKLSLVINSMCCYLQRS